MENDVLMHKLLTKQFSLSSYDSPPSEGCIIPE
jgi:hypothetical protein